MKVEYNNIKASIQSLKIGKYKLILDLNKDIVYIADRMLKDCKCLYEFEILKDTKQHKQEIGREVNKVYKELEKITYTRAKNEYGIELLNGVSYIEVDNPHFKSSSPMKLYFKDCLEYLKNKEKNINI